jgi:putative endonuclease
MKMFFVYILHSKLLNKYYCGYCVDVTKRIAEHNRGKANFTSKGIPWEMIKIFECSSKTEAIKLEMKIKKRGISRFLIDSEIALPE